MSLDVQCCILLHFVVVFENVKFFVLVFISFPFVSRTPFKECPLFLVAALSVARLNAPATASKERDQAFRVVTHPF